ncbi:MAG: hypothetical protein ABI207_08055 [Crocinitomicaceae bacterium]
MENNIPKAFLSDSTREELRNCVMCDIDVYEHQIHYAIEKSFKRLENDQQVTLYEMLICEPCAIKMNEKMSVHSRQMIIDLFNKNKIQEKRIALSQEKWEEKWDKTCMFTGNETLKAKEYNIIGHFVGGKVLPGNPPFVIGEEILTSLQENLSLETKEELDNFRDEFLGPEDPILRILLQDATFVIV